MSYGKKSYRHAVSDGTDSLEIIKHGDSEWCQIKMIMNDWERGSIQIRSREQAEQLHFMLGQMLA